MGGSSSVLGSQPAHRANIVIEGEIEGPRPEVLRWPLEDVTEEVRHTSRVHILSYFNPDGSSVGKRAMLGRFLFTDFELGQVFRNPGCVLVRLNNETISLRVSFSSIRNSLISAGAIIVVYDVTNRQSFDGLRDVFEFLMNKNSSTPRILVATRCDLHDRRVVSTEEGEERAALSGVMYFEVSALTGDRIDEAVLWAAKLAIEREEDWLVLVRRRGVGIGGGRIGRAERRGVLRAVPLDI